MGKVNLDNNTGTATSTSPSPDRREARMYTRWRRTTAHLDIFDAGRTADSGGETRHLAPGSELGKGRVFLSEIRITYLFKKQDKGNFLALNRTRVSERKEARSRKENSFSN